MSKVHTYSIIFLRCCTTNILLPVFFISCILTSVTILYTQKKQFLYKAFRKSFSFHCFKSTFFKYFILHFVFICFAYCTVLHAAFYTVHGKFSKPVRQIMFLCAVCNVHFYGLKTFYVMLRLFFIFSLSQTHFPSIILHSYNRSIAITLINIMQN